MTPPKLTRISLSPTPSLTAPTDRRHCLNADVELFQIVHLTHRAVHHDAFPFVLGGQARQFGVDQRPANRTAAVDQQHAAAAVFFKQIEQQAVILKAFHRGDLPAK